MKTYIKFLCNIFLKSFFYVFFVMLSLVFVLNVLSELDFFKDSGVGIDFTLFLSLLNSPSMIFEMFPFIFLLTTQFFFIKLFNNNELEIFKYSGLKNSKILQVLILVSLILSLIIVTVFYNFSANLKNFYLEKKSQYTTDGKYLAVITNNGLWIKDQIDKKIYIINSSRIEDKFLVESFITEFNENYDVIRNIQSKKINITDKQWFVYNAKIYTNNEYVIEDVLKIDTNFDYKTIKSLYSNLSSLDIFQLFELKRNYKKLNYSLTEVNLQILKLLSYPLYLVLITILSALLMFNTKRLETTTLKISLGLFTSVIIYYINNFFFVMGSTERIALMFAIFTPLLILGLFNSYMIYKINEK